MSPLYRKNPKIIFKDLIYSISKNPLSIYLYNQEIKKRSKLPLTDIARLSQPISMFSPFTSEIQTVNDWYGHAKVLKKFLGLPNSYKFKFNIEHGLYLSDQVPDLELESNLPSFLTYSNYRVKVLKKYCQKTYAIGPFIQYATHYLSENELKNEKKRLGKTLLFFPSHSIIGLNNHYDQDWSYKKIKAISKGFDTIRICMYWKDVLLGKHQYYLDHGFECVTAGHILDPNFLPRVKSIIETADLTVSNDASSPLSYSIAMNKPCIIFYQRSEMSGKNNLQKMMIEYWESEPYKQVIKEFSKIQFKISKKQKDLMNLYCGVNIRRSKTELQKFIDESEKIYRIKNDYCKGTT